MSYFLLALSQYKYLILFPAAVLEATTASLLVGFLVKINILNFFIAFPILLLGDLIPDNLFYYLGYFGRNTKFVKKQILKSELFSGNLITIEKLWSKHGIKALIFCKLAYGIGLPFLLSAGIAKMPYKKFLTYSTIISVLKYGVLVLIGYLLGHSYALAEKYIGWMYIIISVFVLISILIYYILIKYTRNQINSLVEKNKREKVK